MIKKMFSVYDVKTGVYGNVFLCVSDGEALRAVSDEVNNPQTTWHKHSADFRLDVLGEVNLLTGEIGTVSAPRHVIDLAQLKTEPK